MRLVLAVRDADELPQELPGAETVALTAFARDEFLELAILSLRYERFADVDEMRNMVVSVMNAGTVEPTPELLTTLHQIATIQRFQLEAA